MRSARIALAFASLALVDSTAGAGPTAGDVAAVRRRGVLRVAVLDEYPWLKERRGAGEPFEGAAWTITRLAARRIGVRLATVRVGFDDKLAVLDEGRADVTIAPLLVTPERMRRYDVVSYSQASQCLFGRADNPKLRHVRTVDELARRDLTIAVVRGAPQGNWLRRRLPAARVIEVAGNITTVPTDEIVSRRADVATIDQYFFAATARRMGVLASLPMGGSCLRSREFTLPIGLAVPKRRPALLDLFRTTVTRNRAMIQREHRRVVSLGE